MHASVVVLFALVAAAAAQFQAFQQPQQQQFVRPPVPILNHQEIRDNFNQYSYSYATGDGAAFSDHGALKQGPEGLFLARQGSHQYTSPEGKTIILRYTADETGYHPVGDHLPVAPAVPVV